MHLCVRLHLDNAQPKQGVRSLVARQVVKVKTSIEVSVSDLKYKPLIRKWG
jgi:hypothetical protein